MAGPATPESRSSRRRGRRGIEQVPVVELPERHRPQPGHPGGRVQAVDQQHPSRDRPARQSERTQDSSRIGRGDDLAVGTGPPRQRRLEFRDRGRIVIDHRQHRLGRSCHHRTSHCCSCIPGRLVCRPCPGPRAAQGAWWRSRQPGRIRLVMANPPRDLAPADRHSDQTGPPGRRDLTSPTGQRILTGWRRREAQTGAGACSGCHPAADRKRRQASVPALTPTPPAPRLTVPQHRPRG